MLGRAQVAMPLLGLHLSSGYIFQNKITENSMAYCWHSPTGITVATILTSNFNTQVFSQILYFTKLIKRFASYTDRALF